MSRMQCADRSSRSGAGECFAWRGDCLCASSVCSSVRLSASECRLAQLVRASVRLSASLSSGMSEASRLRIFSALRAERPGSTRDGTRSELMAPNSNAARSSRPRVQINSNDDCCDLQIFASFIRFIDFNLRALSRRRPHF